MDSEKRVRKERDSSTSKKAKSTTVNKFKRDVFIHLFVVSVFYYYSISNCGCMIPAYTWYIKDWYSRVPLMLCVLNFSWLSSPEFGEKYKEKFWFFCFKSSCTRQAMLNWSNVRLERKKNEKQFPKFFIKNIFKRILF